MRLLAQFILFLLFITFVVPFIQLLAIRQTFTQTKQISQFITRENIYEKIAELLAQQTEANEQDTILLPAISGDAVQAILSPVVDNALQYAAGESAEIPFLSLETALSQTRKSNPDLYNQIVTFRKEALNMFSPEMLEQVPLDQRKQVMELQAFLKDDKKFSLGQLLTPIRNGVLFIKRAVPVLGILTAMSFFLLLLVSRSLKSKVTAIAVTGFITGILCFVLALLERFSFGLIVNGTQDTGMGGRFVLLLLPELFERSIRYFQTASIICGTLFLAAFILRLGFFKSNEKK